MQRIARHLRAGGRGRAGVIHRAEPPQQLPGRFPRRRGRRIEPPQLAHAHGVQVEPQLAQLAPQDLRRRLLRPPVKVLRRIEPDDASGSGTAGPARPLVCRRPADAPHLKRRKPRPGRVRRDPRQSAIDHGGDALDGERALGHVGGEDQPRAPGRQHGAVLLLRGKVAVQLRDRHPERPGQRRAGVRRPPDLRRAGQKHQHVAVEPVGRQVRQRRRNLRFERRGRMRAVGDAQLEGSALGAQNRAVPQVGRHRAGIQGGRHDGQPQIRPRGPLQTIEQRQRQVAVQMTLVKLVERHGLHLPDLRVRKQPAREHALGHEAQPGAGSGGLLEAHLEAYRFAYTLAQLGRHAPRRHARRQPPRLQHPHLARPQRKQGGRHARGLPGSRRRFQDEVRAPAQTVERGRKQRINIQRISEAPAAGRQR